MPNKMPERGSRVKTHKKNKKAKIPKHKLPAPKRPTPKRIKANEYGTYE